MVKQCIKCKYYKIDKGNLRPFCGHYKMPTFEPEDNFYCKYWEKKEIR